MRSALILVGLTGLLLASTAGDATAQRRGGGWGGGRGYAGGGRGYTGAGLYFGTGYGYGNSGYSNGYYRPYGLGYTNGGYYSPYVGNSYSSYAPGTTYYSTPGYVITPQVTTSPQIVQSGYQTTDNNTTVANVRVVVPTPTAQVWISNSLMSGEGTERFFKSPDLESGKTFTYRIKAKWMADGQSMEKTREVEVRAGSNLTVSFP